MVNSYAVPECEGSRCPMKLKERIAKELQAKQARLDALVEELTRLINLYGAPTLVMGEDGVPVLRFGSEEANTRYVALQNSVKEIEAEMAINKHFIQWTVMLGATISMLGCSTGEKCSDPKESAPGADLPPCQTDEVAHLDLRTSRKVNYVKCCKY